MATSASQQQLSGRVLLLVSLAAIVLVAHGVSHAVPKNDAPAKLSPAAGGRASNGLYRNSIGQSIDASEAFPKQGLNPGERGSNGPNTPNENEKNEDVNGDVSGAGKASANGSERPDAESSSPGDPDKVKASGPPDDDKHTTAYRILEGQDLEALRKALESNHKYDWDYIFGRSRNSSMPALGLTLQTKAGQDLLPSSLVPFSTNHGGKYNGLERIIIERRDEEGMVIGKGVRRDDYCTEDFPCIVAVLRFPKNRELTVAELDDRYLNSSVMAAGGKKDYWISHEQRRKNDHGVVAVDVGGPESQDKEIRQSLTKMCKINAGEGGSKRNRVKPQNLQDPQWWLAGVTCDELSRHVETRRDYYVLGQLEYVNPQWTTTIIPHEYFVGFEVIVTNRSHTESLSKAEGEAQVSQGTESAGGAGGSSEGIARASQARSRHLRRSNGGSHQTGDGGDVQVPARHFLVKEELVPSSLFLFKDLWNQDGQKARKLLLESVLKAQAFSPWIAKPFYIAGHDLYNKQTHSENRSVGDAADAGQQTAAGSKASSRRHHHKHHRGDP